MSDDEEKAVERLEIVLSQYDVCCYALVVSITAISLCNPEQRKDRLRLFNHALDDFEAGLFENALRRAKAAAAPDVAAEQAEIEHDYETLRKRLQRILAQRPGRA